MNNTWISPVIQLVRDLAYVGLFAYAINRVSAYAAKRLEIYGPQGDLFPPREVLEEDEEIMLSRGYKDVRGQDRRVGFVVRPTEDDPSPSPEAPDSETDAAPVKPRKSR
jgi:hypothetical protein